jgi:hypothetical protein
MEHTFRNAQPTTSRVNWPRAALAGLAGRLAAHYANGMILAIVYAALTPSLWGPGAVPAAPGQHREPLASPAPPKAARPVPRPTEREPS